MEHCERVLAARGVEFAPADKMGSDKGLVEADKEGAEPDASIVHPMRRTA
jgi:hypothetical protein